MAVTEGANTAQYLTSEYSYVRLYQAIFFEFDGRPNRPSTFLANSVRINFIISHEFLKLEINSDSDDVSCFAKNYFLSHIRPLTLKFPAEVTSGLDVVPIFLVQTMWRVGRVP